MRTRKHKVNPLRHNIEFHVDEALHITLASERLLIQSVMDSHTTDCVALFGDARVMEKFATGQPYDEEKTCQRLKLWTARWKNHDPYSAYAITDKNSGDFIGIIVMGHSERGQSETSYLIHQKFWGQGYGSEATDAVFQSLVPRLMLRGYTLEHVPLKKVVATARIDNPASQKMLIGAGFKEEGEIINKYGALRQSYGVFAKQLRNDYHHFFINHERRAQRQSYLNSIDEEADVTVAEMAASTFGTHVRK